jgi:phosphate transport system permease protein
MANAIAGTAELLLMTALIGVPVGFIAGVYLAEFAGKRFAFAVRYATDLLNGVPSIVIGIFAYTLVVMPMKRFSVISGAVALSVIVIPMIVRSTEQFIRAVPDSLREGALALGASKWRAIATVVVPAAMKGVITGAILGIARVAGETAPLLFTSFNNSYWNRGIDQPASSLPVMVYTYAISPYEDLHKQAWAAGLVLLVLMLAANIAVRLVLSPRAGARS